MAVVAGIVAKKELIVARDAAVRMLDPMPGPDLIARQCWLDQRVALGARSRDGAALFEGNDVVVVADARLDGRSDLCRALSLSETNTSDAGLIAAGYAAFGDELVTYLRGEFAFAIWNRATGVLFCARDRFGVKPLLYRDTARSLRIATDASALASDIGLSALDLDEDWIVDYVWGDVGSLDGTPYKDIRRLPSAHTLRFENGCLKIARYWTFSDIARGTQELPVAQIRETLVEAVTRRMGGRSVGAFLSGGLDSSSIACVARDLARSAGRGALPTISLVFDETPSQSERPHIEAVLSTGGFAPTFVNIADYRPVAALERLIAIQDGPFFAPGLALMEHGVAAAAAAGLSDILDGHGGDETLSFAGYGRLNELALQQAWPVLLAELTKILPNNVSSRMENFGSLFARYGKGNVARLWRRLHPILRRRKKPPDEILWLAQQWREDTSVETRHLQWTSQTQGRFGSERDHHEAAVSGPFQAYAFEVYARLFRAHGLSPHFPFWDQDVLEMSVRLPAHQKLHAGLPRAALRDAMAGVLPESVRLRSDKLDFSGHLVTGLLRDESILLDIAADRSAECFTYVDHSAFVSGVNELRLADGSSRARPANGILSAVTLDMWFRSRRGPHARAQSPLEISA